MGTNNTFNESSKVVLGKLLDLKKFSEITLPESNLIISNLITRSDNGKVSLTVLKTNEHAYTWFANGYHRQWKYNFKLTKQRRVTFESKRLRQAC